MKNRYPYQVVIHCDPDGAVRAAIAYRTDYLDEKVVVHSDLSEAVTWTEETAKDFKELVKKFLEPKQADLLSELAHMDGLKKELGSLKGLNATLTQVIADRETLLKGATLAISNIANGLAGELKARTIP